jgi:hypothetical protein
MARGITDGFGLKLHGKVGNVVFAQTRTGLVVRPRTSPRDPRTPAQAASRERLAHASATWRTIAPAQFAAWRAYAQTLTRVSPVGGPPYVPAPHNVFTALVAKFLQVSPDGPIPLDPPAYPFFGDGIEVTAAPTSGGITFTASAPNSAGIVTELLLQPLAHAGRAPKANLFRSQAFVAFTVGSLSHTVPAAPGAYCPAVRFVRAATGQEANIVPLASVAVA